MSHSEPHAFAEPDSGAVTGMRGCASAADCGSDRPGHGLHVMQERLAATTASKWIDAIVIAVDPDGFATVAEFGSNELRRVWHHDGFEGALEPGDPVAVHGLYGVLASGERRFSVADA